LVTHDPNGWVWHPFYDAASSGTRVGSPLCIIRPTFPPSAERTHAMTEAEWRACTDPTTMLESLRGRASHRKLRLFAVACCRRVWPVLRYGKGQEAVEMAERFADGHASRRALDAARAEMGREAKEWDRWVPYESSDLENAEAAWAAWAVMNPTRTSAFLSVVEHAANAASEGGRRRERPPAGWPGYAAFIAEIREKLAAEAWAQCDLIRDIFRTPPAIDLAWLTPDVVALAATIYDQRSFDRMPVLVDALEEAGCRNSDILDHCRSGSQHVRGCWLLDALLRKE
jgi:hypothetical protein